MCGLSSDHDHYPYMYLVSVLFKSSCIDLYLYSLTLHPIHFFVFLLVYFFFHETLKQLPYIFLLEVLMGIILPLQS